MSITKEVEHDGTRAVERIGKALQDSDIATIKIYWAFVREYIDALKKEVESERLNKYGGGSK